MARRALTLIVGSLLVFVTSALAFGVSFGKRTVCTAESNEFDVYSPVAPAEALLHAVRVNLKVVRQWLDDGDFDSAIESADRVKLLLIFCEFQSRNESWLERVALLRTQCDQLIMHAKEKDAEACVAMSKSCLASLESLEQAPPGDGSVKLDDLRLPGQVRPFMKLLDGSYTDAKLAKSVDELRSMAYTMAEAANVVQFLKKDATWRERASEARDAALRVAMLKPDMDLKVARLELKNVYERCQACHKEFRSK